jgi:hypothetical protein
VTVPLQGPESRATNLDNDLTAEGTSASQSESDAAGRDPLRRSLPSADELVRQAVGGWRGVVDSAFPSLVFLVAYLVTGQRLAPAVWSAIAAAVIVAVVRLVRHESLRQILGGLVGVAICAWLAARTGKAQDFYLPGLLLNGGYALVLAVSAIIGRPIAGYAVGALTGDLAGWRRDPILRRTYTLVTWLLVTVFGLRLVIQVPLYLLGWVGPLGVARLALGWPLYLGGLFLAYRLVVKARARSEALAAQSPNAAADPAGPDLTP